MMKRLFYLILLSLLLGHFSIAGSADRGEFFSGETKIGYSINSPSYMDTWNFQGQTGDRVIITAVKTSGNLDTEILLYPPGGGSVEAYTPFSDKLDHQLLDTGLYTVLIQDYGLNDSGTYNISFLKIPGAVSSLEDPDGGPIASGQTLSGTINVASDIDAFQLYGLAGDRVIITAVKTSGNLDTEILLYPPGGGSVEAYTPFSDQLDHQLLDTGLYTIIIQDYVLNDAGTYNISLIKIPSDVRPGIYNPWPLDGDIVCDFSGSFSWDTVLGATGYDLYFGEDVLEPLIKIGDNLQTPSMLFPTLVSGNIYYWHVVAHTLGGDIEGPYWWFEVSSTPFISVNPESLNFGSVIINNTSTAQSTTVTNTCTANLIIGTVTIGGANAFEFNIQNDNCSGQTITQTGQCSINVAFSPTSAGQKNANLLIPSNDSYQPTFSVPLSGTGALPDLTPPTPNPMTWATPPYQTGTMSISMVATTANDPSIPINYFIDFVDSPTGGTGGVDSGWQSGTSYTNAGLQTNHQYGYRVKAKDGVNNETNYSTPIRYVSTAIENPTGINFGSMTPTSIQVQSTNTPSGLTRGSSGLIIENITNQTNSDWKQNNDFWVSNSLSPNTSYSFRAKARNGDAIETGYCSPASRYTLANIPGIAPFSNVTQSCIRSNWTANGNPAGTQYFCENTTAGTNSGWITDTSWNTCNLTCNTTYSFRVKAKNGDGVETDWTSLGSQRTQPCNAGLSISLQSPVYGTVFDSCSLINTHQPTFGWTSTETFTKFAILFSSTDFTTPGISIAKGNVKGNINNWTPAIGLWKKMMTWSNTNGTIYWKVVGTRPDKSTAESEVWSFSIGSPQPVTINSPADGATLPFNPPPTFDINTNCNVKFRLEFSPSDDFTNPKNIKGFTFTVKDPVVQPTLQKILTSGQWTAIKKLLSPTGYFRIKAWDAIGRETTSNVRSFNIPSMLIGSWDITGRATVAVSLSGRSQTRRANVLDEFTFSEDGDFEMTDIAGTWTEQGTKFTVNLSVNDVELYFETGLEYALGVSVEVTITGLSFSGEENWTSGTISGVFITTMDINIPSYGLNGTVQATVTFKGIRSLQGLSSSTLKTSQLGPSQSLIHTIKANINNAVKEIK
jgi:hypothetical protein